MPAAFPGREKLIELSAAYHLYAHHWRATLAAFGASLVAHLGTFATFLCVAYAFRAEVAVVDFFAIMPIERTISSLPISFAGVGLREKIFQIMLHGLVRRAGSRRRSHRLDEFSGHAGLLRCPAASFISSTNRAAQTGHVKLREMREEVATLEHEITENGIRRRDLASRRPDKDTDVQARPSGSPPVRRRDFCHDRRWQNHHAHIFAGRFHFARRQAPSCSVSVR